MANSDPRGVIDYLRQLDASAAGRGPKASDDPDVGRSFLFVSSSDPEAARRAVEASPLEIDLVVISPSRPARETADYATAGHWVFTVEEPLLVGRVSAESEADVLTRLAQALRDLAAYNARAPLVVLDLLGSGTFALSETGLADCADGLDRAVSRS